MKLTIVAVATFIVVSLITTVATADEVIVMPADTITAKHTVCTVRDLTQGSGQVRFCRPVTK